MPSISANPVDRAGSRAGGSPKGQTTVIRVLCIDDNAWIGEAIERSLRNNPDLFWEGWLPNTAGLENRDFPGPPDVVLLDIDIPGDDTFAAIERLGERWPTTKVLILSGHLRSDYIDRAVSAGAWGYLSKGEDSATILGSIRRVARGEFVLGSRTLSDTDN